jgi:ascorbate-specific PTS system EIIC-type component UlaA
MMDVMTDHSDEASASSDARMGKAVARGVLIGFPVCLIGLTIAVWLITDLDMADSFATALLPGILLGGFAGGFAGVAATMD